MNRAVARRTLFENAADIRFFLSRIAKEVRAGSIEIHAYCFLTTHFHLLLRSLTGELSGAMRRIQLSYVRRFNRRRRRDGPLMRGRFRSRLVDSLSYRFVLVRYIDANSVQAGLCNDASEYTYGSAHWHSRSESPRWLERRWIEAVVSRAAEDEGESVGGYSSVFRSIARRDEYLIQRWLRQNRSPGDLDDLLDAAPPAILEWMRRKALLGDGTGIGQTVVDPESVRSMIERVQKRCIDWKVRTTQKSRDAWPVATVGLLRDLCGASWVEVAALVGHSGTTAANLYRVHRQLLGEDAFYSGRVAEMAHEAMQGLRESLGVVGSLLLDE